MIYIGIWNNTFNSIVNLFPRLGGRLIGICPILNEATISEQESKNIVDNTENLELYRNINSNELRKLMKEADILYTDTWVDMEYINNPEFSDLKEERLKQMSPYRISSELLKDSHIEVMHDMPIHPGYEIDRGVVEEHIDMILDQGENRRHVAKGIFAYLLDVKV